MLSIWMLFKAKQNCSTDQLKIRQALYKSVALKKVRFKDQQRIGIGISYSEMVKVFTTKFPQP